MKKDKRENIINSLVDDYANFLEEKTDKELEEIYQSGDFVVRKEDLAQTIAIALGKERMIYTADVLNAILLKFKVVSKKKELL